MAELREFLEIVFIHSSLSLLTLFYLMQHNLIIMNEYPYLIIISSIVNSWKVLQMKQIFQIDATLCSRSLGTLLFIIIKNLKHFLSYFIY